MSGVARRTDADKSASVYGLLVILSSFAGAKDTGHRRELASAL